METKTPRITRIEPPRGVAGGEIAIACEHFTPGLSSGAKVLFGSEEAFILSASSQRIVARIPESTRSLGVVLRVGKEDSPVFPFTLAGTMTDGLHAVTNPVVAPDGTILTTISGPRGQAVPQPILRIRPSGEVVRYSCDVLNPTGLAFGPDGQLYVTNRAEGSLVRFRDFETIEVVAEDLGVPCGIVFDSMGTAYVGDRSGRILKVDLSGRTEDFAVLEPSVSAYHLAIDASNQLYLTGPTLSTRDRLYRISPGGEVQIVADGLGRPQGMALRGGRVLLAATHAGRKGVFEIAPESGAIEHSIAAPTLVGVTLLEKDILVTDGSTLYRIPHEGVASRVV